MTYTSRRFFEANPKLCAAFIAALNEADALIARDWNKAASIYLAVSKQKSSAEEILKILNTRRHDEICRVHGPCRQHEGEAGVVEGSVLSAASRGRGKLIG